MYMQYTIIDARSRNQIVLG